MSQRFDDSKSDIRYSLRDDYHDKGKIPQSFDNTSFSLREIVGADGTEYGVGVYLNTELLTNLSDEERIEIVKKHIKVLDGSVFSAFDNNGDKVKIKIAPNSKYKTEKGRFERANRHLTNFLDNKKKQESLVLIDELIVSATFRGTETANHPHSWLDNYGKNNWEIWTTYIQDKENTIWEEKLQVSNSTNGEKILYDVHPIKKLGRAEHCPKLQLMLIYHNKVKMSRMYKTCYFGTKLVTSVLSKDNRKILHDINKIRQVGATTFSAKQSGNNSSLTDKNIISKNNKNVKNTSSK